MFTTIHILGGRYSSSFVAAIGWHQTSVMYVSQLTVRVCDN